MLAPSSTCWEFPVEETLEIARETVDSGLWFLAGYDNGEFVLNRKPREFSPLKNYLLKQARFRHLKEKDIEIIARGRDKKWGKISRDWK